jgi:hypothetical protein
MIAMGKTEKYINERIGKHGAILSVIIDPVDWPSPDDAVKAGVAASEAGADIVAVGGSMGAQGELLDVVTKEIKAKAHVPVVLFNYFREGVGADSVMCDNRQGIRAAVTHLAGLGHRRIAFLGRNEEDKAAIRTSIGPVWDGNEVWLITAGGATFAAFPDQKSQVTRIVAHWPDLFILDRGLQRVYRFTINELGSNAAPASGDGVILKFGDRIESRTVGEIFDLLWLDAGRLVALDRSGAYYQYDPTKQSDPAKAVWTARTVNDPAAWARATMAETYANYLYLVDAPHNQIMKYVSPTADVTWTNAVTYFLPGVTPPDLSTAVDFAIDGDVWILRSDGSVSRYTQGRANDITLAGLDTPISKPIGIFTSEKMSNVYIADAGNQRIVQFDKTTGRFTRQFKPRGLDRDAFKALQVLAVDETNKRFFFVSEGKAYIATIPQ